MTQKQALNILKTGANVFLTGEPGSGKTYTINKYIEYLRECGVEPAITASTGIAATHLGGMTLHSWSGIGINKSLSKQEFEKLCDRKRIKSRIIKTKILIIDEISMLDAQTLDLAESVCRKIKQNDLPWGGLQIIFVGDFFQLPPIARPGDPAPQFAFNAAAWNSANPTICYIEEQYRQNDQGFTSILNSIRKGIIEKEIHKILDEKIIEIDTLENGCTRLFSHNIDVDRINEQKLRELPETEEKYFMETRGPKDLIGHLVRGCLSPEILRLKKGAKVIFTKNNFEEGYVNGTLGIIDDFSQNRFPIVKTLDGKLIETEPQEWSITDSGKTLARISQIPLRLAWAITIHKSQGMTLDSAVIDLSCAFEYGQGYVALSRIKNIDGLYLCGYNQKSLLVHPQIIEIDEDFKNNSQKAQDNFSKIPEQEIEKIKEIFISSCGVNNKKNKKESKHKKIHIPKTNENTYEKTLALWKEGKNAQEIAQIRDISQSTVISHLEELYMKGRIGLDEIEQLISPEALDMLEEIRNAFEESGDTKLSPIFAKFNGRFTYDDLRLARLILSNKENIQ